MANGESLFSELDKKAKIASEQRRQKKQQQMDLDAQKMKRGDKIL